MSNANLDWIDVQFFCQAYTSAQQRDNSPKNFGSGVITSPLPAVLQRPEHLQPMIGRIAAVINAKFWQISHPVIRISPAISFFGVMHSRLPTGLVLLRRAHILLDFQ